MPPSPFLLHSTQAPQARGQIRGKRRPKYTKGETEKGRTQSGIAAGVVGGGGTPTGGRTVPQAPPHRLRPAEGSRPNAALMQRTRRTFRRRQPLARGGRPVRHLFFFETGPRHSCPGCVKTTPFAPAKVSERGRGKGCYKARGRHVCRLENIAGPAAVLSDIISLSTELH